MAKNKFDTVEDLKDRITEITEQFGIPDNQFLLDDDIVLNGLVEYRVHLSPRVLVTLIVWYKRPVSCTDVSKYGFSTQTAKHCETLRDKGFIFRKNPSSAYFTFRKNKIEYREIIGWEQDRVLTPATWNQLSKPAQREFKKYKRKDFLGNRLNKSEIDHRMPEKARKKLGKAAEPLMNNNLVDMSAHNDYQILSPSANDEKREACNRCLSGGEIDLPPTAKLLKSAYKQEWDKPTESCLGCYWYDYLNPLYPEMVPDLEEARLKEKDYRKQLSSKIEGLPTKRRNIKKAKREQSNRKKYSQEIF